MEARLALYIAEHSSIYTVDHLTEVVKRLCEYDTKCPTNAIQLKRTKCTGIIKNVWYPYFNKRLIQDIGETHLV